MFTPSRLAFARTLRNLTGTELAEMTGIRRPRLSSLENGHVEPDMHEVRNLATALQFPTSFFGAEEIDIVNPDSISFRARSKCSNREIRQSAASGRLGVEFLSYINREFKLPEPNVPTFEGHKPEIAAEMVRARWGLGTHPIPNINHLLEYHGIRILRLPAKVESIDAFSFMRDKIPYIFVTHTKSAERSRFDVAHELGHLVLHSEYKLPCGKAQEAEADAFAASFLMPRTDISAFSLRQADAQRVISAKKRWRVSAMALSRRLNDLGYYTEWRYRDTLVNLSQMGYRRGEPESIGAYETSLLLEKVLKALKREHIPFRSIAKELDVSSDDLRAYLFGLTTVPIEGGGLSPSQNTKRPNLHLVR
jgi:Zn-dependent peptidase ImmA (M78 family)/DNA-binding XRE family transcriptional regulator